MAEGAVDVLAPAPMRLTDKARENWIAFHDVVERDLADDGSLRPIRPFGAKMAEHAGRLAAVLATYADPDAIEVDGHAMSCGIALAQHYAAERLRLQGAGVVARDGQSPKPRLGRHPHLNHLVRLIQAHAGMTE
jgi:hypothetical protein